MKSNIAFRSISLAFVSMALSAFDAHGSPVQQESVQCTPQLIAQANSIKSRDEADRNLSLQLLLVRIQEKFLTLGDVSSSLSARNPEFDESWNKTAAVVEQTTVLRINSSVLREAFKLSPCITALVRIRDLK